MKKTLLLTSLAAILTSAQSFASSDARRSGLDEIRGTINIAGGGTVAVNRPLFLQSTAMILNHGSVEGTGSISGEEGAQIINSIGFPKMAERRSAFAAVANPLESGHSYREPKPANIEPKLVEDINELEIIQENTINKNTDGIDKAKEVFVLVDDGKSFLPENENYALEGESREPLSVKVNFANTINSDFKGTPHGLTLTKRVRLAGDNSNLTKGNFIVGNGETETNVTIGAPSAMPGTEAIVKPNALLTLDAKREVELTKKLTLEGSGKLCIPEEETLVIPAGVTLEFGAFDGPVTPISSGSSAEYKHSMGNIKGKSNEVLSAISGKNTYPFTINGSASKTTYNLFIEEIKGSSYEIYTDLPDLSGVKLIAKKEGDKFGVYRTLKTRKDRAQSLFKLFEKALEHDKKCELEHE
ncbi:MAG: hypothetical protein LBU35_00170 [Holosporales bacterium]|jgi:hypothetical protein|nr:hypothetical protein [Holosporales bacterium]